MKKIIFAIILIFLLLPNYALAVDTPGPGANYIDLDSPTKWYIENDFLINEVRMEDSWGTTAEPPLKVYYRYKATGQLKDTNSGKMLFDDEAKLYVLSGTNLSNQGYDPGEFISKYFIIVDPNNYIYGLYYYPQPGFIRSVIFTSKDNKITQDLNNADPNKQGDNWYGNYNKHIISEINQTPKPKIGTKPSTSTNCAEEFQHLIVDINDIKRLTYIFVKENGKEGKYFRPKTGSEIITDQMKHYTEKIKKVASGDSVINAFFSEYETESLFFTEEGLSKLQDISNASEAAKKRISDLESNCDTFIKDDKNYPVKINKYDTSLDPIELKNWGELKAHAEKVMILGELAGQNPTITSGTDWEDSVMKKVVCWLKKSFVTGFYWMANIAAWALRENY